MKPLGWLVSRVDRLLMGLRTESHLQSNTTCHNHDQLMNDECGPLEAEWLRSIKENTYRSLGAIRPVSGPYERELSEFSGPQENEEVEANSGRVLNDWYYASVIKNLQRSIILSWRELKLLWQQPLSPFPLTAASKRRPADLDYKVFYHSSFLLLPRPEEKRGGRERARREGMINL